MASGALKISRQAQRAREIIHAGGLQALFRAIWRKVLWTKRRLFFRPYLITKTFAGHEFTVFIPDLFAQGWYHGHDHWPELEWVKQNLLRFGDVAVDCGANIGFTSALFSRCVGPNGTVIAIEALPRNAEAAGKNVKLNNCTNVTILNVAVGASEGTVEVLDQPNGTVGVSPIMASISVPQTTLDTITGGRRVDFIKIDVEGYEVDVLRGARRTLTQCPALDIEIHCAMFANPRASITELLELIPLSKYSCFLQEDVDGEIRACDVRELNADTLVNHDVVHLFCRPRAWAPRSGLL